MIGGGEEENVSALHRQLCRRRFDQAKPLGDDRPYERFHRNRPALNARPRRAEHPSVKLLFERRAHWRDVERQEMKRHAGTASSAGQYGRPIAAMRRAALRSSITTQATGIAPVASPFSLLIPVCLLPIRFTPETLSGAKNPPWASPLSLRSRALLLPRYPAVKGNKKTRSGPGFAIGDWLSAIVYPLSSTPPPARA